MLENKPLTSIFGLIGKDLGHSFSKAYFSEKFDALQLDDHHYRNFEIEDEGGLSRFRESVDNNTLLASDQILRGVNVTIPYKTAVLKILDELDPIAEDIGAVNCIQVEDGIWKGHNTDAYGFIKGLQPFLPITGHALVLGTGGASQAVSYALEILQIKHFFASRHPDGPHEVEYPDITKKMIEQIELIINTTPLGTHPHTTEAPDIPYQYLGPDHLLYDLVYNPPLTMFMKKGQQYKAKTINGYQMLVNQAERSWEIWNE